MNKSSGFSKIGCKSEGYLYFLKSLRLINQFINA